MLLACVCARVQALQSTAAVFTNGFVFDELPLDLVKSAVHTASEAGAAICFDPGVWGQRQPPGTQTGRLHDAVALPCCRARLHADRQCMHPPPS